MATPPLNPGPAFHPLWSSHLLPRPSPSPSLAAASSYDPPLQTNTPVRTNFLSLPPQRRAETLLRDLAGLSGRILELTGVAPGVAQGLPGNYGGKTGHQFLDAATVPVTVQDVKSVQEVMLKVDAIQRSLTESVTDLYRVMVRISPGYI